MGKTRVVRRALARLGGVILAATMAAGMAVVFTPAAEAAVVRPFTLSYEGEIFGDFLEIGNGNMRCPDPGDPVDPFGALIAECLPAQNRVANTRLNDDFYMNWADVDSSAASFNSTQGQVTVPPGATVEFARLNWGGDTGTIKLADGTISTAPGCNTRQFLAGAGTAVLPSGTPESTATLLGISGLPTTSVAPQVISRDALVNVPASQPQYYAAYADVTAQLQGAATGVPLTVTVGNVWTPEGFGCFAGWSLVLVYSYPVPEPVFAPVARQVFVYDGHVRQSSADPQTTVTIDGFRALSNDINVGVTAFEGDFNIAGDSFLINGVAVAEPLPGGTTTNFFVSDAEGELLPAPPNNFSVDAKSFDTTLIPGGSSSASLGLATSGDTYMVSNLVFSVPVPTISIEKETVGGGPFRPGQPVQFQITVVKSGGANGTQVVVNDPAYADCNRNLATIAPDVPFTYLCSGPAPATTGENFATVTALDEFGVPITDSDTSPIPVINPAIDITKTADQASYEPGETITFTITVNNTGDAPLTGVVVDDATVDACDNAIGTMAPGQIVTYTCTAIAPIAGDQNTATVTGTDALGGVVTDSATADAPTVGTVAGVVFNDRNNNGVLDPADGDTGIGGVTVTLNGTTATGAPVNLTTTTDAEGNYTFTGVAAGTYTLNEQQPASYTDGIDTPGDNATPAGNDTFTIAMPQGGASVGNNFAEIAAGSLAGIVYEDLNGDGGFDAGEPGIPGVTVTLSGLDEAGNAVNATTTTGATGNYSFGSLRPGVYTITETQPAGYLDGGDSVGSLGGLPGNDVTSAIVLPPGGAGDGYDFGELLASSLAGRVVDEDGAGIPGVVISLVGVTGGGLPFTATATTNGDGVWVFETVPPGTYSITETQPEGYGDGNDTPGNAGGTPVDPDTIEGIVIGSGTQASGYVFAETSGSVAGFVYEDFDNDGLFEPGEVPIGGVTVTLTGIDAAGNAVSRTTVTDGAGAYVFDDVLAGEYLLTETQPAGRLDGIDTPGSAGGVAVPPDGIAFTLPLATDAVNYNFGEVLAAGFTGSVIDDQGNGIEGVTITLTGVNDLGLPVLLVTTTDSEGSWSFLGLRPGSYTITETQPAGYGDGPETVGSAGGSSPVNDAFAVTLGSGVVGTGYVFAEDTGSLAGVVFEDANGNGAQDAGEPGIGGVTVTLTGVDDAGDDVTATTITAADGSYVFSGLLSGEYTVTETQPGGYVDGIDTPGSAGGVADGDDAIAEITLDPAEVATGYTFGEIRLAGISGAVVDDLGNPIAGVEIELTGVDGAGNPVTETVVTGPDGTWAFTELPPGTYTVTEVQPVGYGDGPDTPGPGGGTPQGPDSIAGIVLASGGIAAGNTFVDVTSSIAGAAFADTNGNGVQDAGEAGLAGVLVTLTGVNDAGDDVTLEAVTDADGAYVFEGLLSGDYDLTETQPAGYDDGIDTVGTAGGELDPPDSIVDITLGEGEAATGYTFGEILVAGISGRVVDDAGNGIEGVEMTLTGVDGAGNPVTRVTTTGADGSWAFTDLPPGTYTVTETQPEGYGDGPDTPGPGGGTPQEPDSITGITLVSGGTAPDNVFVDTLGSLAGSTYVDTNGNGVRDTGEPGLVGVLVTLTGTDVNGDPVELTAVTADDGSYLFTGLIGGVYEVTETQPVGYLDGIDAVGTAGGVLAPPDTIEEITLDAGEDATGYAFGESAPASITGRSVDEAGTGIAGVEFQLAGTDGAGNPVTRTTVTGPDGTFVFADLPPGVYTVAEVQPAGYADGPDTPGTAGGTPQDPDSITGITLGSGTTGTDYVFRNNRGSIAGWSYEDRNDNGAQDPGEPGIPGVTITLTGVDVNGNDVELTTVTAEDGSYLFAGLLAGEYEITQTQPASLGDGTDTPGSAGGTAVEPDTIAEIVLDAGEAATDYLFGDIPSGVAGTVWVDTDADGVIDEDETLRVEGVTVIVRNEAGVEVGRAVTDAQGAYNVPNLPAGEYSVEQVQPEGYGSTTPNVVDVVVVPPGLFAVVDFGEELGEIGDRVWSDLDRDGVQDDDEPGLGGVTVILLDADGVEVARTVSADDGSYAFQNVELGTYRIGVELPYGQIPTRPNQGDDTLDSDVDWVSYVTEPIELVLSPEGRATRIDTIDIGVVEEQVDLTVDLVASDTTPMVGEKVTFTATVSNTGSTPAFGAEVTLTLPAGFDVDSVGGEGWTCEEVDVTTVRCRTEQVILPGASATPVTMVGHATVPNASAVVTATVSTIGEQVDVNAANDTDSVTLTVTASTGNPPAPGLPGTGAAVTGLIALGALLLVGGATTILVTRRRRPTSAS